MCYWYNIDPLLQSFYFSDAYPVNHVLYFFRDIPKPIAIREKQIAKFNVDLKRYFRQYELYALGKISNVLWEF